jgi:hypothetical protein
MSKGPKRSAWLVEIESWKEMNEHAKAKWGPEMAWGMENKDQSEVEGMAVKKEDT